MEPLFADLFPPADKAAWLTQVQKELKDAAAYESLRWHTDEGFWLEPYYTTESLQDLPLAMIQAAQKPIAGWLNAPDYVVTEAKGDNEHLRRAITQGADALVLNLPAERLNASQLLNGIKLSETPVFFRFEGTTPDLTDFIRTLKTVAPYQLKGGLLTDVTDATVDIFHLTADSPQFRMVCISGHAFHNAGATATQELAFTLASLVDAYDTLTEAGLTIDQLVPKTILSVSVGTSYFLEIAKLRALRVLLHRVRAAYEPSSLQSTFAIQAQTSTFYDAAVAPYTNLLRATTESMAAVLGGCDVLTVHPYSTVLNEAMASDFAARLARNIPLLLKEESFLDKVADPAAGSYYIETLTHQLVEAAWDLFLAVEKQGGLAKASDFVQKEIERTYQAKLNAVRAGKVLVGVTKFRSDESTSQVRNVSENTANQLPDRRLAEEFE